MGGVMVIGYANKTLRGEAPLHTASTPPVEAVLAGGTATMLLNSMVHDMYPATRTAATVCGSFIRKMRHYGEPHPFALNGEQVDGSLRGVSQSPVLWMGILYWAEELYKMGMDYMTARRQEAFARL